MIDKQEPFVRARPRHRGLAAGLAVATALALAGCAALKDATETPEQAAARQPSKVSTEGAKDAFPTLGEVPSETRPQTAPEDREKVMAEMAEDRARATFTAPAGTAPADEPAPLETAAAPRDPFASSLIISGDSVTTSEQHAGLPLQTGAGPGQLAAIIFFPHGSSDLGARDRSILRDLAALQQQRGGGLRVVGHASSRTRNATPDEHQVANFDMSLIRANAVLEELLRLGVSAEAVRAEAVGDAEPVYHEFMPSGEAGNRRVEIFLEN
jgi:outer membrane protein OmpA-like peptidoglycan-associated protein